MPLLMATCDNLMFVLCGNSKVLYVSIQVSMYVRLDMITSDGNKVNCLVLVYVLVYCNTNINGNMIW